MLELHSSFEKMLKVWDALEDELCGVCKNRKICMKNDYYCPAFEKLLEILKVFAGEAS